MGVMLDSFQSVMVVRTLAKKPSEHGDLYRSSRAILFRTTSGVHTTVSSKATINTLVEWNFDNCFILKTEENNQLTGKVWLRKIFLSEQNANCRKEFAKYKSAIFCGKT